MQVVTSLIGFVGVMFLIYLTMIFFKGNER